MKHRFGKTLEEDDFVFWLVLNRDPRLLQIINKSLCANRFSGKSLVAGLCDDVYPLKRLPVQARILIGGLRLDEEFEWRRTTIFEDPNEKIFSVVFSKIFYRPAFGFED